MAHREKHRHAALLRRVTTRRKIKNDFTPASETRWKLAALELKKAKERLDDNGQWVPV